ncbi:amidohydrolase family protein [Solilutibacter silvestris]|uniref:Putative metal-dependent hydrolase of the TIM-barrel fold n=1 Tax=Solilutibacter silvestris TaxID=1645665 RepID=A0A2K1Q0Z3_9GAMM|nr:amidohydrolase family protein [Lysobacter silvestris]PNS08719.1 putative metal-dependent hydrolase of the TIM-barrel fold [Lysobacter silvestris]
MTRIDAHQHFWRYDTQAYPWIDAGMAALRGDRLPVELKPLLDADGIDGCIAVQARADETENAFLLDLATAHPWIVAVVGWLDLFAENVESRLEHWRQHAKFRGVRHLLQDDADVAATIADARFARGVVAVQRNGLVYDVLVRGPRQLTPAVALCARHDRHWLVLDHLGKPDIDGAPSPVWRRAMLELGTMPHVYCKVSGLVTEVAGIHIDRDAIHRHLDAALECFGAERLMFGSDWPVCLLRAGYADVAALVADWSRQLSPDEQARLWGGSALHCYGVQGWPGSAHGP